MTAIAEHTNVPKSTLSNLLRVGSTTGIRQESWDKIYAFFQDRVRNADDSIRTASGPGTPETLLATLEGQTAADASDKSDPNGSNGFFPPGGPIPYDAPNYLARDADQQLKNAIQQRWPAVTLCGGIQMGLTSLLHRAEAFVGPAGARVVCISAADFIYGPDLPNTAALINRLFAPLLPSDCTISDGPIDTIKSETQTAILAETNTRNPAEHLILMWDDLDITSPALMRNSDLPLLVRLLTWIRNDITNHILPLTLILPYIPETNSSLIFSARHTHSIEMTKFTEVDITTLLNRSVTYPIDLSATITRLFHGHPYLTQAIIYDLQRGITPNAALEKVAQLKDPYGHHWERVEALLEVVLQKCGITLDRFRGAIMDDDMPSLPSKLRTNLQRLSILDGSHRAPTICSFYRQNLTEQAINTGNNG